MKSNSNSMRHKLDDAEAALQKAPGGTAVDKAKALIAKGNVLLKFRQKLIKIADQSEYGWAEYVDDELADGTRREYNVQILGLVENLRPPRGPRAKKSQLRRRHRV